MAGRQTYGALVLLGVLARPQQTPTRALGGTPAELSEGFTEVTAIRELNDGRVLILDRGEGTLLLGDFRDGTIRQVGRRGCGPGEYEAPMQLFATRKRPERGARRR